MAKNMEKTGNRHQQNYQARNQNCRPQLEAHLLGTVTLDQWTVCSNLGVHFSAILCTFVQLQFNLTGPGQSQTSKVMKSPCLR